MASFVFRVGAVQHEAMHLWAEAYLVDEVMLREQWKMFIDSSIHSGSGEPGLLSSSCSSLLK